MAHAVAAPARRPLWVRLFFLIPVFGWIARDTAEIGQDNLYYGLFLVVALWALSGLTFGIPGIVIPALAAVPVMFVVLLVITWG